MEKTKLTKREYLGEGYFNQYKNLETGETYKEEISIEEYNNIVENNQQAKPLEGYTWEASQGGVILVDTPSKELGLNEFTFIGDTYYVSEHNKSFGASVIKIYSEKEFNSKYIWQ